LAGRSVATPRTETAGCKINRINKPKNDSPVNYAKHVADNPSNPDPKRVVTWGEQTHEERLVGYVEVASADQDLSLGEPRARKLDDGRDQVTFRFRPPAGTKAIYLASTFNDWKPTAHALNGPNG
jgi:hypothetical protein